eukprot:9500603-Pyramimonas_sp.AAC.1
MGEEEGDEEEEIERKKREDAEDEEEEGEEEEEENEQEEEEAEGPDLRRYDSFNPGGFPRFRASVPRSGIMAQQRRIWGRGRDVLGPRGLRM